MLRKTFEGPSLVVCNTCRHSAEMRDDAEGVRGGARLLEHIRVLAAADPRLNALVIEQMPCLFSCTRHCSVHLRAPGKVGYVMGDFTPDAAAAKTILEYAAHYLESEHGSVAYRYWPQGVKGHFIVRTPPAGMVVE